MGRRIALGAVSLMGMLALLLPGAASAAPTVVVQNNNDAGAGSLRQAILDVDAGGKIVIPASVGEISLTTGQLTIQQSMTIEGAGAARTAISAGGSSRVILVSGTPIVTIEGMQIINGKVTAPGAEVFGGGIEQTGGSLTVVNCVVSGNSLETGSTGFPKGGGIGVKTGSTGLTLRNTVVADSVVHGFHDWGGGVYVDGPSLTIEGGSVKGNTAEGLSMFGGGIYFDGTQASLSRVAITGNEIRPTGTPMAEGFGAGLEIDGGTGNTLEGVTIARNRATIIDLTAENITLIGGGALIAGAAILNTTIASNSITENIDNLGTALAGGLGLTNSATIVNSTLVGNEIHGEGTALQSEGGDLWVAAKVQVENSIFAAGTVPGGGQNCAIQHPNGELTSLGDNIDSFTQCGFHAAGDQAAIDPGVKPLAENGGMVETMALQAGSPAIDAGGTAGCPATDARGVLRPAGAACDVGAFEVATPSAVTEAAGGIGDSSATLAGIATNPDLTGGSVSFQYGTSTAYGSQSAAQAIGATTRGAHFSASIGGLTPGTTYHFRILVANAVGAATGPDLTFTTSKPAETKQQLPRGPHPQLSIMHLGGLRFRVNCTGAPCNGKLVATTRSRKHPLLVAKAKLRLASGTNRKVTLKLTGKGKRLVALPGKLPVVVKTALGGEEPGLPRPLHFKLR